MKKILYLFLIIIGCSTKEENKLNDYLKKTISIHLEGVKIDLKNNREVLLNQAPEMTFVDGLLFINDRDPSFVMKIIDLKNKTIQNFGKKGKGPDEYQSPYSKISMNLLTKELYTVDYGTYRVHDIDSLINNKNSKSLFRLSDSNFGFLRSVRYNNYIIGNTIENRFALYDINSKKVIDKKLEYDKGGAMGNQGSFFVHPSRNKVVKLCYESDAMSIVSFDDKTIKVNDFSWWKNPHSKQITDNKGRTYDKNTKDRKSSFLTAATSKDYIYALYSGKKLGSTIESIKKATLTNLIYVFDWDGNPVTKYTLDQEVKSIAVDEVNNILYAASHKGGEAHIVKYNLK